MAHFLLSYSIPAAMRHIFLLMPIRIQLILLLILTVIMTFFLHKRPSGTMLDAWFNQDYSASVIVDSINSSSNDKCPFILKNFMVFTSNRPGGMGGYDLYYSIFKNGKWNSPVNLGPKINTSSDEYRPVLGYDPQFKNMFLVFSSNKSGGNGGFDLYFTGFNITQ